MKREISLILLFVLCGLLLRELINVKNDYSWLESSVQEWASFYCAGKEVVWESDLRPYLNTQFDEYGNITRVSVVCQGGYK